MTARGKNASFFFINDLPSIELSAIRLADLGPSTFVGVAAASTITARDLSAKSVPQPHKCLATTTIDAGVSEVSAL
eukprot:CAMPEP_0194436034 /NCGR_PEP_ID=MMETSP0176-20130528/92341_1 /TAXON_ID=216777 /ORGANISM="Proboscia alata, Strain PI-D3" /LENGTH=75 /DNA_ID=CAMNT_0039255963 /DNA_START=109 /DNA_END=333 /DNA_ORIENTATION=-